MREQLPGTLAAAVSGRLARFSEEGLPERLWQADPTLWKPDDPGHQRVVRDSLGWLNVFEGVRGEVDGLRAFAEEVRGEGYRHAVLLGMGGSSLAPEVMHAVLGPAPGWLDLQVLDSTDPAAVAAVERSRDLERTLFIVASKSGTTTETACFHAYFFDLLRRLDGDLAGRHFVAVTDEGTPLHGQAVAQGFRAVFVNPGDIGGRYSALSFFGLVPAALMGLDLARLLDGARAMARACGPDVPPAASPALRLGALLAEAALAGHDKLTLAFSPRLAPFGAWVEQLVAESTGKEGGGILPVDLEELGPPTVYGDDRLFVGVWPAGDGTAGPGQRLEALAAAGHPVVTWEVDDVAALGAEFLRWELAVAVAGHALGIDPFDQPNVQESKDNTRALLAGYAASGELLEALPGGEERRIAFRADDPGLAAALTELLAAASPPEYVALQAWLPPGDGLWSRLQALRHRLRDARRVATTLAWGPRYLHSTGQYHKGGPERGLFLQLVGHDREDLPVPGQPYGFSVLKRAQARGDLGALRAHGRRVLRVCLGDDPAAGLDRLAAALEEALAAAG